MAKGFSFDRLKTYLFGFAIGSILVALILLAKADVARRQMAANQAAAAASVPPPTPRP